MPCPRKSDRQSSPPELALLISAPLGSASAIEQRRHRAAMDLAAALAQHMVARVIERMEQHGEQCLDELRLAHAKLVPSSKLEPSDIAEAYDLVSSAFTGRGADWQDMRRFA